MNKEEILKTVTIICSSEEVANRMKENILTCPEDISLFQDTTVIAIENTVNGARMSDCSGVDIAYDMLAKKSDSKIILYHFLPVKYIRERKHKLDIILSKSNVRILEAPFSILEMVNAFQSKNIEIDPANVKAAIDANIVSQLSRIWHGLQKIVDPLHPENDWEEKILEEGLKTAKETFLFLNDKDNAYIVNFLKEISAVREEIRRGEYLDGVFCDIEGTLFRDGTLNPAILEKLLTYKSEGKEITLWSDGNLLDIQSLLDENGISFKLHAKRDFAGAIVEMAIDDMDECSFSAATKIYAKSFIQVKNDSL